MPEKCPLSGGGMEIETLPSFCMRHCGARWDEALRTQAPEIDDYGPTNDLNRRDEDEKCPHERYGVTFSHEALQAPDTSSLRYYSIVDQCEGCETELRENVYTFDCPHN